MQLVLFRRLGLQMLQSGTDEVLARTLSAELRDSSLEGKPVVNMKERKESHMAPSEISRFVQDSTSPRSVAFASRTMFSAIPIWPAVVVPFSVTARTIKPIAIPDTIRSRTMFSHLCKQKRTYDGCWLLSRYKMFSSSICFSQPKERIVETPSFYYVLDLNGRK